MMNKHIQHLNIKIFPFKETFKSLGLLGFIHSTVSYHVHRLVLSWACLISPIKLHDPNGQRPCLTQDLNPNETEGGS